MIRKIIKINEENVMAAVLVPPPRHEGAIGMVDVGMKLLREDYMRRFR